MKILIIGAGGIIGNIITPAIKQKHEVITAGRSSGDVKIDIASPKSIHNVFKDIPKIDACICVAGDSYTDNIATLTTEQISKGIQHKLLSQINLVLIGQHYLNDNGSFILISGKMGDQPVKNSSGKAFINGAINSFVMAASLDMQRGLRINAVSPSKVSDISKEELINAYLQCLETTINGQILKPGY